MRQIGIGAEYFRAGFDLDTTSDEHHVAKGVVERIRHTTMIEERGNVKDCSSFNIVANGIGFINPEGIALDHSHYFARVEFRYVFSNVVNVISAYFP